ncbi:MAG: hypothetical protein QGH37_23305 [Candidatus Poribacteria bacterium]|jgi:hypothetical protein|nr:hypothetical protein [Candidatus Poribacteria bacterium]MDP6962191.1 hypothetical protein [Dehalococcoidia bacterium]
MGFIIGSWEVVTFLGRKTISSVIHVLPLYQIGGSPLRVENDS